MTHRLIFDYFNIVSHAWVKPLQYAYISTQNSMINSYKAKFLWSAHANFFEPIFLENACVKFKFWLQIRNQGKIMRLCINIWLTNDFLSFPKIVDIHAYAILISCENIRKSFHKEIGYIRVSHFWVKIEPFAHYQ